MKKNKKHTPLRYFQVFRGISLPWFLIIMSLACSIGMMMAELEVATMTSDIIDSSQNAINAGLLIGYIELVLLSAVCNIASNYFTRKMEEVISMRIRVRLWKKIMHLPTKYYAEDNGNELVSRVTSDAGTPASLFTIVVSCVVCVVTTTQAFGRLYDTNETLANLSLLIIPMTILFSAIFAVLQFKLGVYSAATMASSLGYLAERVRNFRLIKSAVAEKQELEAGKGTFKNMYKADFLNWLLVAGYQLSNGLYSILFIIIVFVIGGQMIPSGKVTIGDLTGFYMITGVVSMQLMQLFMNAGSLFGTFGGMKKISQILSAQEEKENGEPVPKESRDLVLDQVSFAYTEECETLKEISVCIPAGKVTAVVGGNGAGKSTLFKLLIRLYEPGKGQIRYGAQNIQTYAMKEWRDRFAYVFQNEPLIGGTVRENLLYGLEREVTEEELIDVTKKANCYDCIMAKPHGFEEDTGMDGAEFSGGQAQCISIARAMLRNADYLLLDEATSNLDVVSEAAVTEALHRLMEDKTTIMIAHNYEATKNADYVIVMENGSIEAAGTPAQLLETNTYYQMFSKQI